MTGPGPAASVPFDARPLIDPVDRATVRAHVHQLRAAGRAPSGPNIATIVLLVAVGAVFLGVFGTVFAGIATAFIAVGTSGQAGPLGGVFAGAPIVMLLLIAGGVGFAVYRSVTGGSGERWYRLDRFAQANGMTWFAEAKNPPLPGMIFDIGSERVARDIVRGDRPRLVEFGNHRYTTGSGKNRTTHHWGYVAVHLSSPLPHIVLDAVGNNGLFGSNLPASFDKSQRLSLEGDFDRYFALYCPRGYERDALYLFTPDIMARFIDNAAALDVEIVDDWLFLYAKRDFSTLDPRTWAWLFSVVGALLDKFAQWERWRDDRLLQAAAAAGSGSGPESAAGDPGAAESAAGDPRSTGSTGSGLGQRGAEATSLPFAAPTASLRPPPGVAPEGRRLQRGVPWAAFAVVGAFVVFWLVTQSGVFGAFFFR